LTRRAWRLPLLASALLSAAWGAWLGLLRIGWALPLPRPDQLILHGPLMVGGFVGTLVGLERAIGIARPWAYAAPALSAAGAALLVFGTAPAAGAISITAASGIVTAIFIVVLRAQPTLFAATMLAGSMSWLAGNSLWAAGDAIFRVVFWWIAFLVLTIAGERLELNRLLADRCGTRCIRCRGSGRGRGRPRDRMGARSRRSRDRRRACGGLRMARRE